MKRTPEPELMDTPEQAIAYGGADFSEPNDLFLDLLYKQVGAPRADARVLDLGCGPADILINLLKKVPGLRGDALDGSATMLAEAQRRLNALPGVAKRMRLMCETLPCEHLERATYDLVVSNSLLHHLHEPAVLWDSLKQCAKPAAGVMIMDLMRPASAAWAEAIVATYAADAPEVLREDYRNSLHAAFEPGEVEQQLAAAGLSRQLEVAVVSDRHLAVWGRLA